MNPRSLALVFAGGALGSVLRYLVSVETPAFIWLLLVNLLGAVALGFVHSSKFFAGESAQLFWATGFTGGFTTLSSLITFALYPSYGLVYVMVQIAIGLGCYWLGKTLGRVGA